MGRQIAPRDLLAGGAAALVLVVLVLLLRLNPVLAVLLALAVYAGLALLDAPGTAGLPWDRRWWPFRKRPEESAEELAYRAASEDAGAIRSLTAQVAKPAVRALLDRILERTDQILAVMRADGDLTKAPDLDSGHLEPLRALLTKYVLIATRGIPSAGELLEKIESVDLPLIERAVNDFYERLHQGQMIDLATLSEMLEFNLEHVRATTRRRKTP